MEQKRAQGLEHSIERLVVVLLVLLMTNFGLLFFLRSQVTVIGLLNQQLLQLQQDQQILSSAEQIYQTYKGNIDTINAVFPNEETVLVFLQTLETMAKQTSDESAVKFASFSPQTEGDRTYLLFTINQTTDRDRLSSLLEQLENLPYMTHIVSLSISWVDQKKGTLNVSIVLKLYVQNPFSTK